MICVTIVPKRYTLTSKTNNVRSHHIPRTSIIYHINIIPGIVLVCFLVVHCMVVWLTGIQYSLHILVVSGSLAVVRPSQAIHDATCECRILLFAIFPTVAYRARTKAGSGRGINDTRRRHLMMSGWLLWWIVVARVYTSVRYTRYLPMYMLRKARPTGTF